MIVVESPSTIEVDCTQLISPEHSAQHAMAHHGKVKLLRNISEMANPYLKTVNLRLAALITHEFPDAGGGQLLANALNAAAEAYAECTEEGGRIEQCELAYLSALLGTASAVADYATYGLVETKSSQWHPFCTPLISWVQQGGYQRLVFTHRPVGARERHAAFVLLAGALLTYERAQTVALLLPPSDRSPRVD